MVRRIVSGATPPSVKALFSSIPVMSELHLPLTHWGLQHRCTPLLVYFVESHVWSLAKYWLIQYCLHPQSLFPSNLFLDNTASTDQPSWWAWRARWELFSKLTSKGWPAETQQERTIDWDHTLFNLFVPHSTSISMRKSKIPELPCSSFRQLATYLDLDLDY